MTKGILLDTSTIIDFLRSKDKKTSLLGELLLNKAQLYISIITYSELHAGKSIWTSLEARLSINKLFKKMILIGLDTEIAQRAGYIRAHSDLDLIDAIIAATALKKQLTLATLNKKHFLRVPELKIYA